MPRERIEEDYEERAWRQRAEFEEQRLSYPGEPDYEF